MPRTWVRWMPALVVPAIVAGTVLLVPLQAGAADLPDRTPRELIELVAASHVTAFSGRIHQDSELGLPELPSTGPTADAASALDLLTGSHDARVYADGPNRLRVQVLDQLAERDAVRDGSELWLYSSKTREAEHVSLPSGAAAARWQTGLPATPGAVADRVIAAAEDGTALSVGDDVKVAGRDAYSLVLTPSADDTLVGDVEIAVDAETGVPLRVDVFARGRQEPAFSIGFSSIELSAPDPAVFAFAPPADATVTERALPAPRAPGAEHTDHAAPVVTGRGWDAVVQLAVPDGGASAGSASASGLLDRLTSPVEGGRALSTSLVSVLLTDDGRVLAGAVPVARLQSVAAAG